MTGSAPRARSRPPRASRYAVAVRAAVGPASSSSHPAALGPARSTGVVGVTVRPPDGENRPPRGHAGPPGGCAGRAHAFWYGLWAAGLAPAACRQPAWLAAAGALAAAALWTGGRAAPRCGRPRLGRAALRRAAAWVGAGALGALAMAACLELRERLAPEADPDTLPERPVRVAARVASGPEPRGETWEWMVDVPPGALGPGERLPRRLGVRLGQGGCPAGIAPGAWVELVGDLERLEGPRNPGGTDFRRVARGRGMGGWIRVRAPAGVHLLRPAGSLARAGEALRGALRGALARHLSPGAGAFAAALVLGETGRLPEEDRDGLVALGVIHIVIIAGLHLHLVHRLAAALAWRIAPGARFALPLAVTAGYGWLTHLHLPAQRVLLSLALAEAARRGGRPHSPRAGAALAAALLLLGEPARARDPSYVLSVAATWGLHELPVPRPRAGRARAVLDLARATLLTQVAVWPLLPWTVGRGSLVGLPANLVAVPLAALMLIAASGAAGLTLLAAALGPPLGGAAGGWIWTVPELAGRALGALAHLGVDRLGTGSSLVGVPAAWVVLALAALALLAHGPRAARPAAALAAAAMGVLIAVGPWWEPCPSPYLRLAFLDVGQGDACLLTLPDGRSALVDGGPSRAGWDSGLRVVAP
ncbi:MAG TPA: ComEC/Rec2 family competence protein, partial [Candidatus Saccharimonadales bacterium]|nr:ComEC/Rec2 family competence protein [Candidatus Saccharimonadales bacterium]